MSARKLKTLKAQVSLFKRVNSFTLIQTVLFKDIPALDITLVAPSLRVRGIKCNETDGGALHGVLMIWSQPSILENRRVAVRLVRWEQKKLVQKKSQLSSKLQLPRVC